MPPTPFGREPRIGGTLEVKIGEESVWTRYVVIDAGVLFIYEDETSQQPLTCFKLQHTSLNNVQVSTMHGTQTALRVSGKGIEAPGMVILCEDDEQRLQWATTIIDANINPESEGVSGSLSESLSESGEALPADTCGDLRKAPHTSKFQKRHSLDSVPIPPIPAEELAEYRSRSASRDFEFPAAMKGRWPALPMPLPGEAVQIANIRRRSSLPTTSLGMEAVNNERDKALPPPIPRRQSIRTKKTPPIPLKRSNTTSNMYSSNGRLSRTSSYGSPGIPEHNDMPVMYATLHQQGSAAPRSRTHSVESEHDSNVHELLTFTVQTTGLPEEESLFVAKCVRQAKQFLQQALQKMQATARELEAAEMEREAALRLRQQAAEILRMAQTA